MTELAERIGMAQQEAARIRPKVAGFPYLAETLRQAGVSVIYVTVPSMTTTFVTAEGAIVQQGAPMVSGAAELAPFDELALIAAIRTDQAGDSTYPEFMASTWAAGVLTYDVDLQARTCTYRSVTGERYVEVYPAVELPARA
jgi:uncharacterized protein YbcV (DUF1398 family)